jgi:hypothetical protein
MTLNTMQAGHRAQVAFHLTGARNDGVLGGITGLRPALFAPYQDLTELRYDFPIVLLPKHADAPFASLSSIFDRLLEALTPPAGERERVRKLLWRHERAIRRLVAAGGTGTLAELWEQAKTTHDAAADAALLGRARAKLDVDGPVRDCDAALPAYLFVHAWLYAQQRKSAPIRARLQRLILQLNEILAADFAGSNEARTPQRLQAAIGPGFADAFDFERMSTLLVAARPETGLSPARRARIQSVLQTLTTQRFFSHDGETDPSAAETYPFVFKTCASLQQAYRERMPQMVELARAMAIAALEVEGEYVEAQHDALFADFGANGLAADQLTAFPDYLLWLHASAPAEYGALMGLLAGNLPVKALVQFDDLFEETPGSNGGLVLSMRSKQLADMAIGLNSVFVLQSSASNLVQMRDVIVKGLACIRPGLFSVYSGAAPDSPLPAYLMAAAAMESRAFPAFTYDPAAGGDWAGRFNIEVNPQPDRDWPLQVFEHENAEHQRVSNEVAFTLADFMACDPRYARHYAQVPPALCNGSLHAVHDWLAQPVAADDGVPSLLMTDRDNLLQRVVVDARVIEQTRRCRDIWHSLQELGGIHNSHAERLLARERLAWEAEKQRDLAARAPAAPAVPAAPASETAATPTPAIDAGTSATTASAAVAAPAPSADEPWIETPRCTTCEECVQINNRMFVYDGNKQAYIADLAAGSFRQLVEAAESCQVSIIHPGKPRDPNEPGLADLLERAEAFR